MGQSKRKVVPVASRHLVCLNCKSWADFKSSGCGKTWAETRGESFAFTCKGCTEVTVLVKETCGRAEADGGGHDGEGYQNAF